MGSGEGTVTAQAGGNHGGEGADPDPRLSPSCQTLAARPRRTLRPVIVTAAHFSAVGEPQRRLERGLSLLRRLARLLSGRRPAE